ncbi:MULTISPECIES: hypothetical protein [Lysinibacillus]|uniref:Uncharacterized protein n=1 Tax=Lysinibacillus sphaericus TaxID=1421 RepID=A0AAJ4ZVF6_LYSSH|nr:MULTISPECIES: hypothetical protein [Lysinibacillus]MCS1384455.1 hypothetical protein [Lysinibacillus sphaericus]MED4542478.1 hypothetical protein [Lysinibacillus sphaericus]GEC80260.1 hypothetical protein LSP03_00030 [Lysinibacillus sphaericus]SUV16932.1 Uncharacterised protein [Lysinibacillus sphaericus]
MENSKLLHDFVNYLDDEDVYSSLEKYWMDMFFMWLHQENIEGSDWICPYYNTTFSNGKKMMDGNPIFSAKSKKENKIIKIIQESSNNDDVFSYWINENSSPNELVIVCTLNNNNIEKIKKVIINWIKEIFKDTKQKYLEETN